jgi:hypothetical protein
MIPIAKGEVVPRYPLILVSILRDGFRRCRIERLVRDLLHTLMRGPNVVRVPVFEFGRHRGNLRQGGPKAVVLADKAALPRAADFFVHSLKLLPGSLERPGDSVGAKGADGRGHLRLAFIMRQIRRAREKLILYFSPNAGYEKLRFSRSS